MPHRAHLATSLAAFPAALRGGTVVIGNFDGVHRGHQAVLAGARALGRPVTVLTFEPHPRSVFKPDEPVFRLTPAPLRAELLAALGAAAVVTLPFDAALSALDAAAFVDRVLVEGLGAAHVATGHDFHFGRGRSGTPEALTALGAARGFGVTLEPPFLDEAGRRVASSTIRDALAEGDVAAANAALGWRWLVDGVVVHGDKRGRTLGYPTANMALPPETRLKHGVYAVRARVGGTWYAGAANYGRRIQFGDGPALLETYLMGFSGDLYGKPLRVEFCGHLRPEAKFPSVAALVEQMGRDVDEAGAIVSATLAAPRGAAQAALDG